MLYLAPMTGLPPCAHCGQQHSEDVLLCPTREKLIPLAGRVLDGKFRFVKQLGEGGMGAVWEAENILVKKTVAIKLMHVQFSKDEGVLGRFRNEATAAGRIGSKHICDILDLGRSQLGPYIVMEMLHGADFAGFMQQRTAVDPGTITMVMRQALEGLQAAHAVGIVHRDLKPENIFLHEPEPGQLLVKLMDFGISKFTEGEMAGKTGMGVLMGTPEYMSPEQTEGAAQADHRTDIWAMGVILYWALAGRNPFMGATMASTLINVTTREPIPIGQAVPGLDPGLAAVVDRCIRKNPVDRFESSEAMSLALEPFENLRGSFFVPFLSKSGTTGRATAHPSTPPPGATVASLGPPQMRPPSGAPAPISAPAPAAIPPPARPPSSSRSEDVMVLGSAGASAGPTFSNELTGAPPGASPTMASGGDWGSFGDDDDATRPDSNMGSGNGGFLIIALVALGALVGGGYFAYSAMQAPDAKAVAASAAAKAEEQQAAEKAAEDAAKAAEEAAAAALPDVGAGDEAGEDADAEAEAEAEGGAAEGGAVVAGAEGGAAEGGEDEGGEDEGGADEGGADEGGADEGGGEDPKPSGGGTKPSGGGTKPSGGGTKPSGGGTKPSGGGTKPSGGGTKPSGGDDSDKGSLTPSKPPREDTSPKPKGKKKKKKKKGGNKKKLSPAG